MEVKYSIKIYYKLKEDYFKDGTFIEILQGDEKSKLDLNKVKIWSYEVSYYQRHKSQRKWFGLIETGNSIEECKRKIKATLKLPNISKLFFKI